MSYKIGKFDIEEEIPSKKVSGLLIKQ